MKPAPLLAVIGAVIAYLALHFWGPKTPSPPFAEASANDAAETAADAPAAAAAGSDESGEPGSPGDAAEVSADAEEHGAKTASLDEVQDQEVQAGMAYLDSIRQIPDAAPLLDDIVAYLKQDDGHSFSLEGLKTDANGLAIVDHTANSQMIKDPEILAKWEKLMKLIAANGEK